MVHGFTIRQESFGIECARMAKVPEKIIFAAAERAAHMQEIVQKRASRNRQVKLQPAG